PDPTKAPDSSLAPVAYIGPALTIRQTALRTGVSVQDEQIMEMLEVNTLVHVTSQTWVGQEGWSLVMVMADKQAGYVPNASLRYIDESEAAYHLAKLQPQNIPTATPTRQPDQRTGYSITRGENVPLRSFPDTNAQIATLLPEGAVVNVRGQEYTAGTTWDVVQYAEYFGYVRSDQLRIFNQSEVENYLNSLRTPTPLPVYTPEPVTLNSPSSYGYVSGDRVILRNEPSIKAKELKLMNKYSFALVYGSTVQSDGTWYRINQDGTVGHVRGDLFTVLSMGELSNFLQSPEYLNANAVTIPASGNYQQQSQITPLESFNTTVWQNPALISASYEPFNPLGTPTPPVEAILTPSPSPSPSPSPTLMTVEGFEEPPPEKKDSGFPTGLLTIGLIMLLGGGGYYAYYLYHQNQKRAAARAAQRRAQAARQAGQPQTRPAGQQPSPYIPPRPGAQGTA
ncbi:MAG TPA: SH3 domain-containing protein, partial [Clostridia bacterium]|nr:SH3 domain-containing protein [Clostridia bacterium]